MQYYAMAAEEEANIDASRLADMPVVARTNHLRRLQRAMKQAT